MGLTGIWDVPHSKIDHRSRRPLKAKELGRPCAGATLSTVYRGRPCRRSSRQGSTRSAPGLHAREGGGEKRIERQHAKGKLTARERIDERARVLLDEDSFEEWTDMFVEHRCHDFGMDPAAHPRRRRGDRPRARSTAGWCSCSARTSRCSAARCPEGARGEDRQGHGQGDGGRRAGDRAERFRRRAHPGRRRFGLSGYAEVFERNVDASGVIPQISMIMGPCAGGAVYSPAMTDFIFMVKDSSYMFVTGPRW